MLGRGLAGGLSGLPDLPEAERVVGSSGSGAESGSVGRLSELENASGVSGELSGLYHGGVLPDADVVGPSVGGNDLLVVVRPLEGADLSSGVDGVEASAGRGVPETNGGIGSSGARSQGIGSEGAPGESLDSCAVIGDGVTSATCGLVPQIEQIVISSGCENRTVVRPRETANLLLVTFVGRDNVLLEANVVIQDDRIATSGGNDRSVPGQRRDSSGVTSHLANLLRLVDVPELYFELFGTDREPLPSVGPLERSNLRSSRSLAELNDLSSLCGPDVDCRTQSNRNAVIGRPIQQIQVVVVEQIGGIQDTLGRRWDVARAASCVRRLSRGGQRLRVKHSQTVLVACARLGRLGLAREDAARLHRRGREE